MNHLPITLDAYEGKWRHGTRLLNDGSRLDATCAQALLEGTPVKDQELAGHAYLSGQVHYVGGAWWWGFVIAGKWRKVITLRELGGGR